LAYCTSRAFEPGEKHIERNLLLAKIGNRKPHLRQLTSFEFIHCCDPSLGYDGDRVGRAFPLTLVERLAAPALPGESAARLASLLDAAAQATEALEAAIAALPGSRHDATGQPLVAARRCAGCRSPAGGLAAGTGVAA
jgi:hypothetical protein